MSSSPVEARKNEGQSVSPPKSDVSIALALSEFQYVDSSFPKGGCLLETEEITNRFTRKWIGRQYSRPSMIKDHYGGRKAETTTLLLAGSSVAKDGRPLVPFWSTIPGRARTYLNLPEMLDLVPAFTEKLFAIALLAPVDDLSEYDENALCEVTGDVAVILEAHDHPSDGQIGVPSYVVALRAILGPGLNDERGISRSRVIRCLKGLEQLFPKTIRVLVQSPLQQAHAPLSDLTKSLPSDYVPKLTNADSVGDMEDVVLELLHFAKNGTSPEQRQEAFIRLLECAQSAVPATLDMIKVGIGVPTGHSSRLPARARSSFHQSPLLNWMDVPAGPFLMGSDDSSYPEENPMHRCFVESFRISAEPVNRRQFLDFLSDTGYDYPGHLEEALIRNDTDSFPVNYVSWYDAHAWCSWATDMLRHANVITSSQVVRLPSEAEWEKASRGVDGRLYPWGAQTTTDLCNAGRVKADGPVPTGSFSPEGDSPFGLKDAVGNLYEWTRSLWGRGYRRPRYKYPYRPDDGRENIHADTSVRRVVRGGAFYYPTECVRCSTRNYKLPYLRQIGAGFRVVISDLRDNSRETSQC